MKDNPKQSQCFRFGSGTVTIVPTAKRFDLWGKMEYNDSIKLADISSVTALVACLPPTGKGINP